MKCPSCSAEIADKAIVCYRCGAPTAIPEPVRRPMPPRRGRARLVVLLVILVALIALLLFTLLRRDSSMSRAHPGPSDSWTFGLSDPEPVGPPVM